MKLLGSKELRARLDAIGEPFRPIGRTWGRETVKAGRQLVPSKTGRLRKSLRVTSSNDKTTRVGAHYTGYFVDAGVKPHMIRAKGGQPMVFKSRGRTIFARAVHHRGYRARPWRRRAAREGLERTRMDQILYDLWNKAA